MLKYAWFTMAWLACSSLASVSLAQEKHTTDSLETVKKNLTEGKAILVDVREHSEWGAGHLKLAKLLPLSEFANSDNKKEIAEKSLDKTKIIYTHCKAGGRCLTAAKHLKTLGYDVRALKPGYEDLLKAGFEKAEEKKP